MTGDPARRADVRGPPGGDVAMQYLGGKARTAPLIAPYLTKWAAPGVAYWEPFLGGASVAAAVAPAFPRAVLADAHAELVELWRSAIDGWQPPDTISESEYHALRAGAPSALRTLAGFGASYGGKWWGGYARPHARQRDHAGASCRSLTKRAACLRGAGIELRSGDYRATCRPLPGDVVYLDPPYAGTTGYSGVGTFDHEALWGVAEAWALSGVHVYVSEFAAPAAWSPVWAARHRNELRRGSARTDSLFTHSPEAADGRRAMTTGITMPTRRWGDDEAPAPAAPTVVVSSRDGAPVPKVGQAMNAEKIARANGWEVTQTYARAEVPATFYLNGRAKKPAHTLATVAVRFIRGGIENGFAIWEAENDGRWYFQASCFADSGGLTRVGARGIAARLATDRPVDEEAHALATPGSQT